jgi:penicillin-binding protein 2
VDATNSAIGQGSTLVTPLQVARFVSAVGNGGTLYRPQIIERITPPDGETTFVFEPDASESLPVTTDTLKIVQDAMVSVVSNPRGTAYYVLGPYSHSSSIPLAGKTGTAESGSGAPHAWFAGYTTAGREDKPDIAIAVVVENAGEGSEYAAPIFKGLIQLYFTGNRFAFPWESAVGVLATPEPEGTETPEP